MIKKKECFCEYNELPALIHGLTNIVRCPLCYKIVVRWVVDES